MRGFGIDPQAAHCKFLKIDGYPQVSPYLTIANRQAEIMIRIASEFGFSPCSRSRIAVLPGSIEDLPAARYLSGAGQEGFDAQLKYLR